MFKGSIPALITPFAWGEVCEGELRQMVELQIEAGAGGIVACGTTGESPTLTHEEHLKVVRICVEAAAGRVPVIGGAGSNSTTHAIALTQAVKDAGADAALVVAPYYNRPSQDGIFAHFAAIHYQVDFPVLVYNVPSRTVVDISVETMGKLANYPNIIGVKDATSDISRVARHRAVCGDDFILLSGDDGSALAFNAAGGQGCISVTANVAPKAFADMQNATLAGDFAAARAIDAKLAALHKALFVEPSPAPTKFACARLGLCSEDVRQPILPLSEPGKAVVRAAMAEAGLL